MDKILERIMDSNNWPSIQIPENLELLNEMADNSFNLGTFEGKLSATLMYHQILEAMCMHLLEDCHFLIQLAVYPSEIEFTVPSNKMLGFYVKELKSSVSFLKKKEFIEKVELLNSYRIDAVHKMRRSNLELLSKELQKVKQCFDEIYDLYDEIQDDFRVTFHSYQKDTFIDYLDDEE
ncbi:MAG: hypothetical protein V3G42_10835 [Oscillospiraceae bacterium]